MAGPGRKLLVKRSVVFAPDEYAALKQIADVERRSINSVVRQAIAEFLARRGARQRAA